MKKKKPIINLKFKNWWLNFWPPAVRLKKSAEQMINKELSIEKMAAHNWVMNTFGKCRGECGLDSFHFHGR